ncbi:MAG TPA: ribonuclease R, partial [Burkholderiaceae bacterium]|nr:ribonuclease R [Burkholderiaceae bacterium]
LDGRKIDFRMVREGDAERLLARLHRDKVGAIREDTTAVDELDALKKADREIRGARRAGAAGGKRIRATTGTRSGATPTAPKNGSKARKRR